MDTKLNDYFLNSITNPTFSPKDFYNIGITADNTSLLDSKVYKDLTYIQEFPLFLKDGKFDETTFNNYYLAAADGYLKLSQYNFADAVANLFAYYKDDVLAPKELKVQGPEFNIVKEVNPLKLKISVWGLNSYSAPTLSEREIAESNLVFDTNTNSWQESPNDLGFFGNLRTTKVLAQWDFDADINGNLTSDPSKVVYKKGLKKLNYKNLPYYENLGGRSTYGREVLSAFDTITKDGSAANSFDFFDSDDIHKSTMGTLVKNVVKVAPAFIPHIAPWYLGARVGLELADFGSKLLKMTPFVSSDNATLSAIEGVTKSLTFSQSDYGRDHAWGLENLFNMGADVFTQLAEQRWIFESVPQFIRGNRSILKSQEAIDAYRQEQIGLVSAKYDNLFLKAELLAQKDIKSSINILSEHAKRLQNASSLVNQSIELQLKGNYSLGKQLGRLYMTGVTIADAYEEAKEAGMDDSSAAMFMLAYGAMEYGVLSTQLGEWFFPELRMEKARYKRMLSQLYKDAQKEIGIKPAQEAATSQKVAWYRKMINKFTDFFKQYQEGEYSVSKDGTAKILSLHLVANAIGEGSEEVVEEAIRDAAKVLSNEAKFIGGGTHLRPTWETEEGKFDLSLTLNDYALNFVGGFIGGGLGLLHPSYREATRITQLNDKNSAYQELLYHLRNHDGDKIRSIVKKFNFEDSNLSSKLNSDMIYTSGSETDNLNLAAQTRVLNYIDKLELALDVTGAKDGQGILSDLALKDLRFASLLQSNVASSYLLQYHDLIAKNVSLIVEKQDIQEKGKSSDSAQLSEDNQKRILDIDKEIKINQEKIERFHNGEEGKEFVLDALFELNDSLSSGYIPTNILLYIQWKELNNGKLRDIKDIPKQELDEYKQLWAALKQGDLRDLIRERRKWFDKNNQKASEQIYNFAEKFIKDQDYDISTVFESWMLDNTDGRMSAIVKNFSNLKDAYNSLFVSPTESRQSLFTRMLADGLEENDENILKINKIIHLLDHLEDLSKDKESINTIIDFINDKKYSTIILNTSDKFLNINELIFNNPENKELRELQGLLIKDLKNYILNIGNFDDILINEVFGKAKYIHPSTKQFIIDYLSDGIINNEGLKTKLISKVNEAKNTPMLDFLDSFSISLNKDNLKVSELISILEKLLHDGLMSHSLSKFGIDADTQEEINRALDVIKLAQNHLAAARTDNANASDLYGYNVTSNELLKTDLSTIDTQTYNALQEDLIKISTELQVYKKLVDLNSGEILAEQDKIKIKLLYDKYNFIKKYFYINIPDEWEGKKEFVDTINNLGIEILNKFSDEPSKYPLITDDDMTKITKAELTLARAIYKLFNNPANKDKNIFDILDSLEIKSFITVNDNSLDASVQKIESAKLMLTYIAAAATLDYAEFLKAYISTLDSKFVPLTGLMDMLFVESAYLKNRYWFDKIAIAYNAKVDKIMLSYNKDNPEIDHGTLQINPTVLIHENLEEKDWDDHIHILFTGTFLIEGGPGTGKSTANNVLLFKIMLSLKTMTAKKIFIVGKTIAKALELVDLYALQTGLNKDLFKVFTHDEYLKYINSRYTSKKDNTNYVTLSTDDVELDEHKIYHYKYENELNLNKELPGLVVIDEVTLMTLQDMLLHEAYIAKTNSKSIATGDFFLSVVQGRINNTEIILNTYRNNFISFGLYSLSMRSTNLINTSDIKEIKRQTIDLLIKIINDFDPENPEIEEIKYDNIKYVENKNGLYGIKSTSYDQDIPDDVKQTIELMFLTLNEGEKIVYIYNDEKSKLYEYLNKENQSGIHEGKIIFRKGSALGEEGQYYILELPPISNYFSGGNDISLIQVLFLDFYTSISRALLGTLVVFNELFDDNIVIENERVETPGLIEIGERNRIERINLVKTRYLSILEGIEPLEAKQSSNSQEITVTGGALLSEPITDLEEGDSDITVSNQTLIDSSDNVTLIHNKTAGKTYANLYSFNTFSLGVNVQRIDKDGNIIISKEDADALNASYEDADSEYKSSIDGLHGLQKLIKQKIVYELHINGTTEYKIKAEHINTLKILRYYLKYSQTNTEWEKQIKDAIQNQNIKIKFAFKSYPYDNSSPYPRMQKTDDAIGFIGNKSLNAKRIRNKGIYAIITDLDGNELFETLIYSFPNILSLLDSLGLRESWELYKQDNPENSVSNLSGFMNKLSEELKTEGDLVKRTNLWAAILLIKIFIANEPCYIELPDFLNDSSEIKLSGPMIVSHEKGKDYWFTDEYEWDQDIMPLADVLSGITLFYSTSTAYTPNFDITDQNGKTIINAGLTFVLISEDPAMGFLTDKKWIEKYIEQESQRSELGGFYNIKLLLINSPSGTIGEYLDVLDKRINNLKSKFILEVIDEDSIDDSTYEPSNVSNDDIEKQDDMHVFFGNRTTNLRMLHTLLNSETFMNELISYLNQNYPGLRSSIEAKLNHIKDIINTLENMRLNKDPRIYKILGRRSEKGMILGDLLDFEEFKKISKFSINGLNHTYLFKNNKLPVNRLISSTLWKILFRAGVNFGDKSSTFNPYEQPEFKKAVLKVLVKEFPNGVYYHIPLKHSKIGERTLSIQINDDEFIPLDIQGKNAENPWTFNVDGNNLALLCVAKIDATIMSRDINLSILKPIAKGYYNNSTSETFKNYVNKKQEHKPEKAKPIIVKPALKKQPKVLTGFLNAKHTTMAKAIQYIIDNENNEEFRKAQFDAIQTFITNNPKSAINKLCKIITDTEINNNIKTEAIMFLVHYIDDTIDVKNLEYTLDGNILSWKSKDEIKLYNVSNKLLIEVDNNNTPDYTISESELSDVTDFFTNNENTLLQKMFPPIWLKVIEHIRKNESIDDNILISIKNITKIINDDKVKKILQKIYDKFICTRQ